MKNVIVAAMAFLCLGGILFAQSPNYYWADGKKISLTEDRSSLAIYFQDQMMPNQLAAPRSGKASLYVNHQRGIVQFDQPQTSGKRQLVQELGLSNAQVRSISFGWVLSDGFPVWLTHEVVVKPLAQSDFSSIQSLVEAHGATFLRRDFETYVLDVEDISQVLPLANALQESGLVEWATPDLYAEVTHHADPLFSQQFQMNNTGQTIDGFSGTNDMDCNALEAWGVTLGSSSITVAVIDDGVEAHEDLVNGSGGSRVLGGYTPANNGNGTPNSAGEHGEACAGIVAASHNNIGVQGVAPNVNLRSVNIFAGGETAQDIANGITWAKNNGADVMSNSWGYTSCTFSSSSISSAISDAITNGRGGLGCVMVFASGNGYKSCVDFPANLSTVIAVGAFGNDGIKSDYSNSGSALDIAAPSNDISSSGFLTGAGVRTIDRMGSAGYSSGNYTNTFGGTSAACPVVAGVAALVLSVDPGLTDAEVKNILYTTANDMGASGRDNLYGHGRVDAFGAVQAAGGSSGGGGNGCTENELTLTLVLDQYPGETTWDIRDGNGSVVASGGPYSSANSTQVIDLCLGDGCYDFTINDSYGDGICCAYGNGSYSLDGNGTNYASGGSFSNTETTNFCLGGGGGSNPCPVINFNSYSVTAYGSGQDNGSSSIQDGGATLFLQNNAWKDISYSYTVTSSTVIEFDFRSTIQGEIHGIGFDTDEGISSNRTFKVHGTQNWGITNYDNYSGSGWTTYTIPVGSFYTGSFSKLFFVADHDGGSRNGNAYFRNVKVYEGSCGSSPAVLSSFVPGSPIQSILGTEAEYTLDIFPSPATSHLNVQVEGLSGVASYQITDLTGKAMSRGVMAESNEQLNVSDLPAGMYLFTLVTNDGSSTTRKFLKAKY